MGFPGIPLAEVVVRDIAQSVVDKLDASDFEFVEYAIGQLQEEDRDQLRQAFRTRPGKARLGYHLEAEEDWCITVCLASTEAAIRSIGDAVGPAEEYVFSEDLLPTDITAERGVVLPITVPPPPENQDTITGGLVRLEDEVAVWAVDPGGVRLTHRGVQGTGASSHAAGITVSYHSLTERLGWGEYVRVRCDILSTNPWFNLVLSTFVKAAFLANAVAFNDAGCTLREVTESDLSPRPETWPAHMTHRTLLVTVQRDFTVPEELRVLLDIISVVETP